MADTVHYRLQRMTNEFDDLERLGIFTRREIAEIVRQRQKFEYRLKRPSPLKQDFLAYIDYEKHLDSLRLLRKKAVVRELKKEGNKKIKKSISDFASVSRIIDIYRLATNRFKGDFELWFQYLEFCRERQNGRMRKVLAQVIRFHPKVPGVWIYAAAWEFDSNLNVLAARNLMQSGLRLCPTSEDLWIEYLRMELTYLNKLKARKVALGEDEGTLSRDLLDADGKQWRDENKELFMAFDEDKGDKEVLGISNETPKKLDVFREHGLNILQAVYSGATEAIPSSLGLRTRFLDILEATDLADSVEMRKQILAETKRDFSGDPEYWDWLARFEAAVPKGAKEIDKAIQVYEEALKNVPSAAMFGLYIKFLSDSIVPKNGETPNFGDCNRSSHVDPTSHLLMVLEKAESMGCITEELACQHISFLLQLGRLDEAKKLAEKFCDGKLSDSIHLWVLRLSVDMKCNRNRSPSSKADQFSIFDLLRNVLTRTTFYKAEDLWLMAFKFFSNQKPYLDKLVEIAVVVLARDGGSDSGFSLSSVIVNSILQKDGIPSAREVYKRFLALPHPGLLLYRSCIALELNLAFAGNKDCLERVRKLYDSALASYEQDVSLWQEYYSMEMKMGTSETAAAVHWRARKTLKGNVSLLPPATL